MTSPKIEPCQRFERRGLCVSLPFLEWKNGVKQAKKVRNYQHFDEPLHLDKKKDFNRIIKSIEYIKAHQFLPFIKKEIKEIRFRRNKESCPVRSVKSRPIMYASHLDAHIYSFYNFFLSKKYEKHIRQLQLDDVAIAYRKIANEQTGKGKSNINFANEAFVYIQKKAESVVITHDIEHFFDEIEHKILKNRICRLDAVEQLDESFYKVFKSLTKYRYVNHDDFVGKKIKRTLKNNRDPIYKLLKGYVRENQTNKGIPQGSPISGLLANIYLIDFDASIKKQFPNIFYRRYSDDLIFICDKDEKDDLLNFINQKIKEHLLKINPDKSFICYFTSGSDGLNCSHVTDGSDNPLGRDYVSYLGFEFDGKKVLFRKNTIQKLKHRQIERAKKLLLNVIKQKRMKPRKFFSESKKYRSNYFGRALEIIPNSGIRRQILKVARDRNKIKV